MWRYQVFARKLTWYFIGVYIIIIEILYGLSDLKSNRVLSLIVYVKTVSEDPAENRNRNLSLVLKVCEARISKKKREILLICKLRMYRLQFYTIIHCSPYLIMEDGRMRTSKSNWRINGGIHVFADYKLTQIDTIWFPQGVTLLFVLLLTKILGSLQPTARRNKYNLTSRIQITDSTILNNLFRSKLRKVYRSI